MALLRPGDVREWHQKTPNRLANLRALFGAPVLYEGLASHRQVRRIHRGHGHGFPNRVRFNMYTKNGKSDIAVMSLSCRPSHNMNLQISMKRQSDQQFVDGELKVARKSLSTLQTSTDSDFRVDSKWQELGGSEQAASYFQLVDTHQTSFLQSQGCSDAQKGLAKEACSKHLGEAHGTPFFEDCIFDICHGAGEMQAELAAELLAATKAD